jgi:hypothetical protein
MQVRIGQRSGEGRGEVEGEERGGGERMIREK